MMPPSQIDGADVVAYVLLDANVHRDSGSIRLIADGMVQSWFYGLVIAQYEEGDQGTYLFFCDADWETENDTDHDSIDDAMNAARAKFGIKESEWKKTQRP